MLLEIRAFNEAARALLVWVALSEDEALPSPDEDARQAADDRLGLMTPVLKGVFTDLGFANAVKAQQVLGGHGYIAEWGMEQFVRDARIAMIYEGANGVQALDLVGRKLPKDGGRAIMAFFGEVYGFLAANKDDAALAPYLGAAQDRARPFAAGDDVADEKRHEESRQRRRRLERLHAPLRPDRARLHVGADRQGGAGAPGAGDEQPGARRQIDAREVLQRAYAAGNGRASGAAQRRRRDADGAAGGGVLKARRGRLRTHGDRGSDALDRRLPVWRGALSSSTAEPSGVNICHCRMCQKASGAPFMAFGGVRGDANSFSRAARSRSFAVRRSPSAVSAPTAARR